MHVQVEGRQHVVDLEESVASQFDLIVSSFQQPLTPEAGDGLGEALEYVYSELATELGAVHSTQFELQNEFPDESFFVVQEISAFDRELPILDTLEIRFDGGKVLVMGPGKVGKGRRSDTDEIPATILRVLINKRSERRLADRGVRTA